MCPESTADESFLWGYGLVAGERGSQAGGEGESGGRGLRRGVGGLVRRALMDRGCSQALTQRWVQLQEGTSKGPLSLEGSV